MTPWAGDSNGAVMAPFLFSLALRLQSANDGPKAKHKAGEPFDSPANYYSGAVLLLLLESSGSGIRSSCRLLLEESFSARLVRSSHVGSGVAETGNQKNRDNEELFHITRLPTVM